MRSTLVSLLLAASARAETFHGRGVYYLDGIARCPLAGVGTRGDNACLRIALDDDASIVEVDRAARQIVFRNARSYPSKTIVGDVLLFGIASTSAGARSPVAVHLFVRKKGSSFQAKPHAHAVTRERPKEILLDEYQITLDDGAHRVKAVTPESARQAVLDPGWAARMANELVEVKDNLAGGKSAPGAAADVTVALGVGKAAKDVARARLSVESKAASVVDLLRSGNWELRITALSGLIPKDVIRRDLFLYGLEGLSLLDEVKKRGLAKGQSIAFTMRAGKGTLSLGKDSADLPAAADSARAFLEFSFLGAILEHQAERALAAR